MKLSIVILNYNTRDLLYQTLSSIETHLTHEIIVVDNASTDGSAEMVAKDFPQVKLVLNQQNHGFAAGNNIGLNISKGDFVMLLNSDTKIINPALDLLIKHLENHPKIGIITPKLLLADGSIDLACHRGFPKIANSLAYFLKLEEKFPNSKIFAGYHQTWKDFETTHEVDAVSGAAMIIRGEVIDQIGHLDEQFFMYAEDIDFCYRAKQNGWQIVYFPEAKVMRFKCQTGNNSENKNLQTETKRHFYQTMKQYFAKHYANKYPKPVLKLINLGIDVISKIKK